MPNGNSDMVIFGDDPACHTGFGRIVADLVDAALAADRHPVVAGLKQGALPTNNAKPICPVHNVLQRNDPRGQATLNQILTETGAKTVVSIGDPWDLALMPELKQKHDFRWIAYTPVDTTPFPRFIMLLKAPPHFLDAALLLAHADDVVTFSRFGLQAVMDMLDTACKTGAPPCNARFQQVYPGTDTGLFRERPRNETRRQVFKGTVPNDAVLFACVKVNSLRAGFDSLFDAFARSLAQRTPNEPRWILYMHTALEQGTYQLPLLAARHGIKDHVVLNHGLRPCQGCPVQLMPAIYSAADVLVSTTRGEGFGFNVIEALSCSRPCIVPDAGCPSEYGGKAVLRIPIAASFNPEFALTDFNIVDTRAMAAAMVQLARSPVQRADMGRLGRNLAEQYTRERFIREWVDILQR